MLFNMGHTHKYFSPVFLFLVCSMCIIMPVNAQRDKQIWKEAEKSLSVYDYGNALKNYDVLYDKYPDNANYAFKIGYCYLYGSELNDVDQAIEYLKKAQKNITEKYNDNFRETKSPPETEYFLGVAYRLQSDYEKAIEHFKAYKSYKKKNMESLTDELIDREISSCEFAPQIPLSPLSLFVAHIRGQSAHFSIIFQSCCPLFFSSPDLCRSKYPVDSAIIYLVFPIFFRILNPV